MKLGLDNKNVLITGGSSGIGACMARAFAEERANIAITYYEPPQNAAPSDAEIDYAGMNEKENARVLVTELRAAGARAVAVGCDLSAENAAEMIINEVTQSLGVIDILINNAAHCELPDTILKTSPGVIGRHFDVNVRSAVLLIRGFAEGLITSGARFGRVINISTDGATSFPGQISYGASKAAMEAYTRALAVELAPHGITVNAIAPGPIQTGWIDSELEQRILPDIPVGRLGLPRDIADMALFLCSGRASFVTGQIVRVDGGHS